MTIRIRPLHPDFGAEIIDCDPHQATSQRQIDQLRDALDEYQLLLFRGEKALSPERQVEIGRWFGKPVDNGEGALWSVLQNEAAAGSMKLPFHLDFSYTDSPIQVISLHSTAVPPSGTTTSFASGICSWERLPADLQELLAPMTLRHRHVSSIARDWPEFIAGHPVRKLHPRTGRPILFVTEHHADRIHELDAEKSREMLDRLFVHMYEPSHVYTHNWRLYDLVIWDNLALQHARLDVADPAQGKRAVQRVIMNDVSFPELIERARRQQELRSRTA